MRPLSFLNEAAPRPTKRGQERRGEDQDEVQVGVDEQGHGSAQGSTLHAVRPHDDREYFKENGQKNDQDEHNDPDLERSTIPPKAFPREADRRRGFGDFPDSVDLEGQGSLL